jgi:hypothetical protein
MKLLNSLRSLFGFGKTKRNKTQYYRKRYSNKPQHYKKRYSRKKRFHKMRGG